MAWPSKVVPLKMARLSSLARAAEIVPVMLGVLSSLKAPSASTP